MPISSPSLRHLLREIVLYLGASPQSRWHPLETVRNLDDHLLRDIGLRRSPPLLPMPPVQPDLHV
jgi:uncharacterized protein YjiS (DUF1127 family)